MPEGAAQSDGPVLTVLAVDTAQGCCSAALVRGGVVVAERAEPIKTGHAEALFGLIDEVLHQAQSTLRAVDRFAATIGPGSFTGLRVGLAAARGLGLAGGVPVVGVTTLAALAEQCLTEHTGERGLADVLVPSFDARRGELYWQAFSPEGEGLTAPVLTSVEAAAHQLAGGVGAERLVLTGSGRHGLAAALRAQGGDRTPPLLCVEQDFPTAGAVGRLAARLADPLSAPAVPLYLRAPDAVPGKPVFGA